MLLYILIYLCMWVFTSVLMACTYRQDPKSYIVWDTDSFIFTGFFWPLFLPPTLVRIAVRYWSKVE